MSDEKTCERCGGRGCVTETSIACLGCCPDCGGAGVTYVQHGNRGLGGYQCTCGRFARFIRWQATGAPGYERGYLVNCKRCGEVLVF